MNETENIKLVAIGSVKEWKDNPRKNDSAVPKLAELLKVHGQVSPIVCDAETRVIYKGNTTWKALKSIGAKHVKVMFRAFPSEAAAIAYGIADNKSSEFAEWDEDLLSDMLSQKELLPFSKTGFTEREVSRLLMEAEPERVRKSEDDDLLANEKVIRIKVQGEDYQQVHDALERLAATLAKRDLKMVMA